MTISAIFSHTLSVLILGVQYKTVGHAVAQLVEALHCMPEGRGVRFPIVSLEFFIDIILPAALSPWERHNL
jgi:hypothetical protein